MKYVISMHRILERKIKLLPASFQYLNQTLYIILAISLFSHLLKIYIRSRIILTESVKTTDRSLDRPIPWQRETHSQEQKDSLKVMIYIHLDDERLITDLLRDQRRTKKSEIMCSFKTCYKIFFSNYVWKTITVQRKTYITKFPNSIIPHKLRRS